MCRNIKMKNGFTLIEIIVAIGLFSIVITSVVGIFVSGTVSQKMTFELYIVQREAGYLMETMSRELKMATIIADDQEDLSGSIIEFTNYESEVTIYCRAAENGVCDVTGDYISRNGAVISSSGTTINNLVFYTSEDFSASQPMVTIAMKIESIGQHNTEILLQNSVVIRIY